LNHQVTAEPTKPIQPCWGEANFQRGLMLKRHGQQFRRAGERSQALNCYEDAARLFEQVLDAEPSHGQAWFHWGTMLCAIGAEVAEGDRRAEALQMFQNAVACFDRAFRLKGQRDTIWLNRGIAYGYLGRHLQQLNRQEESLRYLKASLKDLNQALLAKPKSVKNWLVRGISLHYLGQHYQQQGEVQNAIQVWQRSWQSFAGVLQLQPDHQQAQRYRDAVARKLRRFVTRFPTPTSARQEVDSLASGNATTSRVEQRRETSLQDLMPSLPAQLISAAEYDTPTIQGASIQSNSSTQPDTIPDTVSVAEAADPSDNTESTDIESKDIKSRDIKSRDDQAKSVMAAHPRSRAGLVPEASPRRLTLVQSLKSDSRGINRPSLSVVPLGVSQDAQTDAQTQAQAQPEIQQPQGKTSFSNAPLSIEAAERKPHAQPQSQPHLQPVQLGTTIQAAAPVESPQPRRLEQALTAGALVAFGAAIGTWAHDDRTTAQLPQPTTPSSDVSGRIGSQTTAQQLQDALPTLDATPELLPDLELSDLEPFESESFNGPLAELPTGSGVLAEPIVVERIYIRTAEQWQLLMQSQALESQALKSQTQTELQVAPQALPQTGAAPTLIETRAAASDASPHQAAQLAYANFEHEGEIYRVYPQQQVGETGWTLMGVAEDHAILQQSDQVRLLSAGEML
ncbi:MAG: hypothetical protein AAGF24_07295, partial [Cyanobacteria bacterium P01_H01_bin.121]